MATVTKSSEQPNAAAVAAAASAQQSRVASALKKPTARNAAADRSKHYNFDAKLCAAYRDPKTGQERLCWVSSDGKTIEKESSVEIEIPPMLLARGSRLVGEGNAFREIKNKGLLVDRAQARFSAVFIQEVSEEMAAVYPDWRGFQASTVDKVRAACLKMIGETFEWRASPAWAVPIKKAEDAAYLMIKFPGKEEMEENAIRTHVEASVELLEELKRLAMAQYLKKARYPFKQEYDEKNKARPIMINGEGKVYVPAEFNKDVYNNTAKGPDNVELPTSNANMRAVFGKMAQLVGKGGKGIDKRVYSPIKFVNCMKKAPLSEEEKRIERARLRNPEKKNLPPKKRDPMQDRPDVLLPDGTLVPDYVDWNPVAFENGDKNGKKIQTYATAVLGLKLTCSELGGYGIKVILRNARKIYIQDYEEFAEREGDVYGKRIAPSGRAGATEDYDLDDEEEPAGGEADDAAEEADEAAARGGQEPANKRARTAGGAAQPPQQQPAPPPQTATAPVEATYDDGPDL